MNCIGTVSNHCCTVAACQRWKRYSKATAAAVCKAAAHAVVTEHAKVAACKGRCCSSMQRQQQQQGAKAAVHAVATAHAEAEVT